MIRKLLSCYISAVLIALSSISYAEEQKITSNSNSSPVSTSSYGRLELNTNITNSHDTSEASVYKEKRLYSEFEGKEKKIKTATGLWDLQDE